MSTDWHEGERAVQVRAGVVDSAKLRNGVRNALPPHFIAFIDAQRFVVLATCDAGGALWCSMVAGWPGFAQADHPQLVSLDRRAFADSTVLGRLAMDPRAGLLAIDPSTRRRIRINGPATITTRSVVIQVDETFGNCQQYIQKRAAEGPVPSPTRVVYSGVALETHHREWIACADTCFLASMHARNGLDASHRGGRPGFVRVHDAHTVSFHDYHGNDMFQSLGNLSANPAAAMLFVNFHTGASLELSGRGQVVWDVEDSPTSRSIVFTAERVVEKHPAEPWTWPVIEYSPVNP